MRNQDITKTTNDSEAGGEKCVFKNKSRIEKDVKNCKCDKTVHMTFNRLEEGQKRFTEITKNNFKKIVLYDIANLCNDLKSMLQQQSVIGGFIPLTDLQGGAIKNCKYVMKNIEMCKDPVVLFDYVNSFGVPISLGRECK